MKIQDKMKRIWVHPSFANAIKSNAAFKGLSTLEYTKSVAKNIDPIDKIIQNFNKKKKRRGFDFM